MQFSAKFVAYHMLVNDPKSDIGNKLALFDKNIAMGRKGLRLFKSVEIYQKLVLVMNKEMPQFDFALEVISNVGMMFRWAYDNLAFLEKAKIIDKNMYGVTSNKYRVVAVCAYIILATKKFLKANDTVNKAVKEGNKESLKAAQKVQFEAMMELIGRLADQVNALHSSKLYTSNDSVQGFFGLISASVALRKVWNATKA